MAEYNYGDLSDQLNYQAKSKPIAPKIPKKMKELQQCKNLLKQLLKDSDVSEKLQHLDNQSNDDHSVLREAISQIMDRNSFTQTKFMDCRELILQQETQNLKDIVDNFQLMSFIVENGIYAN